MSYFSSGQEIEVDNSYHCVLNFKPGERFNYGTSGVMTAGNVKNPIKMCVKEIFEEENAIVVNLMDSEMIWLRAKIPVSSFVDVSKRDLTRKEMMRLNCLANSDVAGTQNPLSGAFPEYQGGGNRIKISKNRKYNKRKSKRRKPTKRRKSKRRKPTKRRKSKTKRRYRTRKRM